VLDLREILCEILPNIKLLKSTLLKIWKRRRAMKGSLWTAVSKDENNRNTDSQSKMRYR
jgi:hypothetical protein